MPPCGWMNMKRMPEVVTVLIHARVHQMRTLLAEAQAMLANLGTEPVDETSLPSEIPLPSRIGNRVKICLP